MAITGIDHIVMRVPNLEGAIAILPPKASQGAMLQLNEAKANRFAEQ